jgi:gluconokinase
MGNHPQLVSAYEKLGGIVWVPRMLRKIRLRAGGDLPADFQANVGKGFDLRCARFLGVSHDALVERVVKGETDEQIIAWCMENGSRPTPDQILVWNEFMTKRGWRDTDSPPGKLQENKEKCGLGARADILTFFDFYDVDEGRKP